MTNPDQDYYFLYYTKENELIPTIVERIEDTVERLFSKGSIQYMELHEGRIRVAIKTSSEHLTTISTHTWENNFMTPDRKITNSEIIAIQKVTSKINEPIMVSSTDPISYLVLRHLAQTGELGDIKDIELFTLPEN